MFATRRRFIRNLPLLGMLAGALLGAQVQAQSTAKSDSSAVLDEVIVTAQKRQERLQDVPVAVSAISGAALNEANIVRFDDVQLPALRVGNAGFTDALFIRGIGSGNNQGFEQSAPIFIDGTWYGNSRTSRLGFLDVGQLEVLKGPQTTFFGKNAIGGAISINSKRPTKDFEASFDAAYEFEAEEVTLTGAISGPITDRFRARLAVRYRDLNKGWLKNTVTGADDPLFTDKLARLSAEFDITSNMMLFAKVESVKSDQTGRETQLVSCTPLSLVPVANAMGVFQPAIVNTAFEDCTLNNTRAVSNNISLFGPVALAFRDSSRPQAESQNIEMNAGQLKLEWNADSGYRLAASTAYYDQDFYSALAQSHNANMRATIQVFERVRGFSQEILLDSPADQTVGWRIGAYHDDGSVDSTGGTGIVFPMGQITQGGVQQTDQSSSVFGEVSFKFTDTFKAKLGARYTDVSKNGIGISRFWTFPVVATPAGPAPTGFVAPTVVTPNAAGTFTLPDMKYDDSSTDPAVTLEWRPMQDTLVYASWRKGFKAGGLNHGLDRLPLTVTAPYDASELQQIADLNKFRPERVKYYELGAKFTFLDGAARLNAAAFKGDYTDLQVAIFNSETAAIETTNAGAARSQGIELDGAWAPSDNWRVNAAVTFLDTKYLDFKYVGCYTNPPQTAAQGCVQVPGALAGVLGQDRSGQNTQFAPDFSGTFAVQYRRPLSMRLFGNDTRMTVTGSAYNSSEYFTDNAGDPDSVVSGYTTADLRLGLSAMDDRWEIALLGRNLGDKLIPLWIGNQPQATVAGPNAGNGTHFATTRRGREFALQLRYAFGK